jgi:ribonuclease HII
MSCSKTFLERNSERSGDVNLKADNNPTLDVEHALMAQGATTVAGLDEVGRGAWAGPVMMGVVVVTLETPATPKGVRDSKLVAPAKRSSLVPVIEQWAADFALGSASPAECDEFGMTKALGLAAVRALLGLQKLPDVVLLDGPLNLLATSELGHLAVRNEVKADLRCGSVAAASILAKVARDRLMTTFEEVYPGYDFAGNKGYHSTSHVEGLDRFGLTEIHRVSWSFADGRERRNLPLSG